MRATPVAGIALAAALVVAAVALFAAVDAAPSPACAAPCGVRLTAGGGPANEVDLTVDPTDPARIVAVAKDYTLGPSGDCGETRVWAGIWRSVDGGATWTRSLFPGHPGDAGASAASGYPCMSDPVAVFGPDGTLYFVGLALAYGRGPEPPLALPTTGATDGRAAALVLGVSRDAGATWDRTTRIADTESPLSADKEWLAVGPDDELALGWHTVPGPIGIVSRSSDGGRTWTHDAHPATAAVGVLLAPFFGIDGTLHAATNEFCADPHVGVPLQPPVDTCMVSWTEGAAGAWTPYHLGTIRQGADPTTGDYRAIPAPVAAVDLSDGASRGRLALAWTNASSLPPYRYHPAVAVSDDDGANWRHVTPPMPRALHQTLPRVAISPVDGTLGLLYYEDTGTNAAPGLVTARFVASRDGGASWSAPIDLSPAFDPRPMLNQYGVVFLGDYNGLAVGADGVFHAAWADGRHGRSDVYAARIVV